jgi:Predicted pyridoxal phosphate-dependent enzyme apparently involved in regulation of cell wall biogenesis
LIPMVDLRTQYHSLKADIDKAVLDALDATQFILGPNVKQLEEEVSQSLAVPHVISCASGTDALHLALAALGIGPGDEVITTPFTFIATAEAIAYVGATPVFVDIDARTFNLDLAQVRSAITPKTKAVIAVHLFGQPADVHGLMEACCKDNLYLIEDCAQSFGATVGGKPTGGFGVMGCFSSFQVEPRRLWRRGRRDHAY